MKPAAPNLRQAWPVLRRLLGYGRGERGLLFGAMACMGVLAVTTGAYAYLSGPALRFLLSGGELRWGPLGDTFPALKRLPQAELYWALPGAVVAIGVVKAASYLGQFYWMGLFAQRLAAELRRAMFRRMLSLSPSQLAQRLQGDLLSRLSADIAAVEVAAMYSLGSYWRDGVQLVVLMGVALWLDWQLALVTLALVPVALLPAARLTRELLRRTREGASKLGEMAGQMQEGLGGLRTIQAFSGADAELARFDDRANRHLQAMTRAGWVRGAAPGAMELLGAAAVAGALVLAFQVRGSPPESVVSLLATLVLMYQPVKDLGRMTPFTFQAAVAGERLFEVLDLEASATDVPDAREVPPMTAELRLEEVSFAYGDAEVLDGVSLRIPRGQVVGLVGPSGGGKSTVVNLLLRFERLRQGRLLIDGQDAARVSTSSVRRQFALVTQEPRLFAGTLLENLLLAREDATPAEAEAACQQVGAAAFIEQLPESYRTPLGERGAQLSGGQRQLLCLARALLSHAPVLVLDEATSNLDPESERQVQAGLRRALVDRTALVIAHRLSTVADADRIYVLERGRVVEEGTHADLLSRGGAYARLWRLQSGLPEAATPDI